MIQQTLPQPGMAKLAQILIPYRLVVRPSARQRNKHIYFMKGGVYQGK